MAASLGSEGHIITLPPLSVVADRHVNGLARRASTRAASVASWETAASASGRGTQERRPCNREHVLAGEKALSAEGGHGGTNTADTHTRWEHTPSERDVGRVTSLARPRPRRGLRFQPAREPKMGAEPICSGFSNKEQSGMMKCARMLA